MLPAGLSPLRHRPFALFWAAGAASDIGTWVQLAAIGSLVAVSSGSALATGMVAAATFAPQGICSPIGGLLADRFERRRTFLVTLGAQAIVTIMIAIVIASGLRNPLGLSALVLLQSSAGALGGPSLQAILPDLVPPEELTAAVALGITSWNSGRVIGPLLATALVPFGSHWAVAANGISFAVLWVAILAFRRQFFPAAPTWTSVPAELRSGIRAMRRSRGCFVAMISIVSIHLIMVPFMGLIPSTLHRGRILSWYQGMNGLAYGIGLLGLGVASDHFGLRATFAASGAITIALVVIARRSEVWADAIDGHLAAATEDLGGSPQVLAGTVTA